MCKGTKWPTWTAARLLHIVALCRFVNLCKRGKGMLELMTHYSPIWWRETERKLNKGTKEGNVYLGVELLLCSCVTVLA